MLFPKSRICVWVCVCALEFLAASRPGRADSSYAVACDYDELGPGGYFQGQPDPFGHFCQPQSTDSATAFAQFSFVIHPEVDPLASGGTASSSQYDEHSSVYAIAEDGGGAAATGTVFYTAISVNTGLPDPHAMMLVYLLADADVSTTDKFSVWNNAGYSVCIGDGSPGDCSSVLANGGWNLNDGTKFYNYNTNLGFHRSSLTKAGFQGYLLFQAEGATVSITDSVYANLDSLALVDPIVTVLTPGDILMSSAPANPNPNAPLFTPAEISGLQANGIDISDLEAMGVITSSPEPAAFGLFSCAVGILCLKRFGLLIARRYASRR